MADEGDIDLKDILNSEETEEEKCDDKTNPIFQHCNELVSVN